MKAGYSAIYPADDNFFSALVAASSSVLCGSEESVIFAYSDERIPDEYKKVKNFTDELPLAFACIISNKKNEGAIEMNLDDDEFKKFASTPKKFLNFLENSKAMGAKDSL